MKIVIFAAGSRGDIQPCVALGRELQKAGYIVQLAVPENFSSFVINHNLEFYSLRGDIQEIMRSKAGRNFLGRKGMNPLASIKAMRKLIEPVVMDMISDACESCREADALICLGIFYPFGRSIAERVGIPILNFEPAPLLPTGDFPAPSWPVQRDLGKYVNRLSGRLMLLVLWMWFSPYISKIRKEWNLPSLSFNKYIKSFHSTPMMGAYSELTIPRPGDWPENLHITGYLYLEESESYAPSAVLESFLNSGSPPVYIGFGSMVTSKPQRIIQIAIEALKKTGQRGIIVNGWDGYVPGKVPDNILILKEVPHSWLFPKMAVLVHHGGAGTTAEGLRSGIPSVIVPFAFDQLFWGKRLQKAGLGPEPIPIKRLSANRLAKSIEKALHHREMRENVCSTAVSIASEDSSGKIVSIVEKYLNISRGY